MTDRRKLGYWNLDQIRTAEEQADFIRQKTKHMLDRIKRLEPTLRHLLKMDILEIDQAASDIFIAMGRIEIERPAEAEEEAPQIRRVQ